MESLTNAEIEQQINELQFYLVKRQLGQQTIVPKKIVRKPYFSDVNDDNVKAIQNADYHISEKIEISGWYYNNLSLHAYLSQTDDSLYLLECVESRVQCEGDSDYDSEDVDSDCESDEVHITKIRKQYYLTKTDVVALLEYLLEK